MKLVEAVEMMQKNNKQSLGFTLIELIVGLGIFIVLLLALGMMMMNVFRSDKNSLAYEKLQNDSVKLVNDLIHVARFSNEVDVSKPGLLRIGSDTSTPADGVTDVWNEYEVDADGRLLKDGDLFSSEGVNVIKWEVETPTSNSQLQLILIRFNMEDKFGRKIYPDEKVFALSVRSPS